MEVDDEDVSMGEFRSDALFPRDDLALMRCSEIKRDTHAQSACRFGEDVTAAKLLREQQKPNLPSQPSASSEGIW